MYKIRKRKIKEKKKCKYDIIFSKHCLERYCERMKGIAPSDFSKHWVKIKKLEKEIIRKGIFYCDKRLKYSYYCVINNLKVYRVSLRRNHLFVGTCYPYRQSLRGMLSQLDRAEFPGLNK